MYNSLHVEALRKALDQMKAGRAVFEEYCTEECGNCPLKKVCGYMVELDLEAEITDAMLDNFVDYHEEAQNREDRQNFKDATGIDPAWYDFNEDRTKGE